MPEVGKDIFEEAGRRQRPSQSFNHRRPRNNVLSELEG